MDIRKRKKKANEHQAKVNTDMKRLRWKERGGRCISTSLSPQSKTNGRLTVRSHKVNAMQVVSAEITDTSRANI